MRRVKTKKPPAPRNEVGRGRRNAPRHDHGHVRASDRPAKTAVSGAPPPRSSAPPGTPILMLAAISTLCAIGITRVHTRTRVLEIGAEISDLTAEQANLMDHKRRLEAERAFLRHPDRVRELARDQLGMVPARAEGTQTITLETGRRSP